MKKGLYALYLRKSRADLEKEQYGQFETLAMHEKELCELAKREGYPLDEPYYKELVSGEKISERTEFQKLIRKIQEGVYSGVLVHSISRLGRGDPMEYGYILFVLKSANCVIVTPSKIYNPADETDARFLQMEMFVSNMELGNIKSRLVSGSRASARSGCFVKSRPPYGYNRVKINGKWTLKPNEKADTVKLIFDKAIQGKNPGTIARELNELNIPSPKNKTWSSTRVRSLITNPHYMGKIRYGYYQRETVPIAGTFDKKTVYNFNNDCMIVDGLHEAIIPPDQWHKANTLLVSSAPLKRGKELQNPLAGLIFCSKCGHAMVRFKNKVKSNGNIIPHLRHAQYTDCKMRGANLNKVMKLICDALKEISNNLEVTIKEDTNNSYKKELKVIKKELSNLDNKLEKLFELYCNEAITIDEFKERRKKFESNKKELESKLKKLQKPAPTMQERVTTIHESIDLLLDDSISAQRKNDALKQFIERIEYTNINGEIRLHIKLK